MKFFLFILAFSCLIGSNVWAEEGVSARAERAVTPEAEALLEPGALARYAEPGNPERYRDLLERLQVPVAELGTPALNLRIPMQSWPNGRAKTMIYAKEAWFSIDMMQIRGREVRIERMTESGVIDSVLTAHEVQMDRTVMLAVVAGKLTADLGEDHLDGKGALIDFNAQYVKVLRDARIITPRLKDSGFSTNGML